MQSYSITVGTTAVNLRTEMIAADASASRGTAHGHCNITFKADSDNTGVVAIGGSASVDVDPTAGSLKGVSIEAGESYSVPAVSPSDVWLKATAAGQIIGVNVSKAR